MKNMQKNISDYIVSNSFPRIISSLTLVFALIYHLCFMIAFNHIGIKPMAYFNVFSVTIFGIQIIVCFRRKIKDYLIPYFISYCEVLGHQILAEYYLGTAAAFHYFILMMGFIAYLMLKQHIKLATFFGVLSTILFIGMELMNDFYLPVYLISHHNLFFIRCINITFGILIIFAIILIFIAISSHAEHYLENKVDEKSREVDLQISKVNNLQNHIIISLASLVENRDSDTGEHIQRTSAYVELIARKAWENGIYPEIITKDFIKVLKRAAPMHDVGKIIVPDYILKKPGKLTPEEFEQIKRHTTEGGRIINEVVGVSEDKFYLKTAGDVALCHHERWDGTGYPNNLKGQNIPVSARIMAIADVFDALVSPRCYKEPFPREVAYKIIEEEKGTHFDPVLADLFLASKTKIDYILKKYTK